MPDFFAYLAQHTNISSLRIEYADNFQEDRILDSVLDVGQIVLNRLETLELKGSWR